MIHSPERVPMPASPARSPHGACLLLLALVLSLVPLSLVLRRPPYFPSLALCLTPSLSFSLPASLPLPASYFCPVPTPVLPPIRPAPAPCSCPFQAHAPHQARTLLRTHSPPTHMIQCPPFTRKQAPASWHCRARQTLLHFARAACTAADPHRASARIPLCSPVPPIALARAFRWSTSALDRPPFELDPGPTFTVLIMQTAASRGTCPCDCPPDPSRPIPNFNLTRLPSPPVPVHLRQLAWRRAAGLGRSASNGVGTSTQDEARSSR